MLAHLVEQHAEEASFLWLLRSYSVDAPHYRLKDLAKLDSRVEAHLDGLRIAGLHGWQLCEQALATNEVGELFAATMLALESKDATQLNLVLAVAESAQESRHGLLSAFGWIEPRLLGVTVKSLLDSASEFQRWVGLSACAMHRQYPGSLLDDLVRDTKASPLLRARALRMVGELKHEALAYDLTFSFSDPDPNIRFWAAWSSTLLGDRHAALEVLKTFCVLPVPHLPDPLPVLLRALPLEQAHGLLKSLAQQPQRLREVVRGTGIVGDPVYIPWLIQNMQNPQLARLAGEAFSLITGVDLAYEDLEYDEPHDFEPGPSEDPADDNVQLDDDENQAWPDSFKIQAWWQARAHQFQPGYRYLLGLPVTEANCQQVLRSGYQRQRAAAALELALINKKTALFPVKAPGWCQQQLLAS